MRRMRHQVTRNMRTTEDSTSKVSSKDRKARIRYHMWVAGGCLLLAMAATLVQVALLQFVEGEDLKAWALRNYVRSVPVDARRGDVPDRTGELLAVSVNRWAVSANPQEVRDPQWTATLLADLLNQDRSSTSELTPPWLRRRSGPAWSGWIM